MLLPRVGSFVSTSSRACSKRFSSSQASVVKACKDVRQLALPVAFLSVKGWGKEQEADHWRDWAGHFSKAGYSSLLLEVDPSGISKEEASTSEGVLKHLDGELTKLLRDGPSPFPPFLISSHLATLLAETHVSSNPLSGLLLHTPALPPSVAETHPELFPTKLKDFDYEPKFPIAVMGEGDTDWFKGRLVEEYGDYEDGTEGEVATIEGGLDKKGWRKVIRWMGENGL